MVHQEFSEEGRKERFEQWEKLGLDRVKSDLKADPYRRIGSGPVQNLAWEWVRMKEAEQSRKSASEVMGLTASPAAAAMGLKEPSWPVGDAATQPEQTSAKVRADAYAEVSRPSGEILTLKPTVYGVGVDLKELGRRLRSWWARRQGRSS